MRANVYIRRENEKKWEAIKNKSAFVNGFLGGTGVSPEVVPKATDGDGGSTPPPSTMTEVHYEPTYD